MNKRSTKMIEVILACCCLGIKYPLVRTEAITNKAYYARSFDLNVLLLCLTYTGYLYLFSIFTMSAISGQPPGGFYVKFFNILGAVLFILSELLLFQKFWTVPLMFGLVFGVMLIVILILDCLNIVF